MNKKKPSQSNTYLFKIQTEALNDIKKYNSMLNDVSLHFSYRYISIYYVVPGIMPEVWGKSSSLPVTAHGWSRFVLPIRFSR